MATREQVYALLDPRYPNEFSHEELAQLSRAIYDTARMRQAIYEYPFTLEGDPDDEEVLNFVQNMPPAEVVHKRRKQHGINQAT